MTRFLSDIVLPFPNSNDLNSRAVVLNAGPLDWKSSALTTRPLLLTHFIGNKQKNQSGCGLGAEVWAKVGPML